MNPQLDAVIQNVLRQFIEARGYEKVRQLLLRAMTDSETRAAAQCEGHRVNYDEAFSKVESDLGVSNEIQRENFRVMLLSNVVIHALVDRLVNAYMVIDEQDQELASWQKW